MNRPKFNIRTGVMLISLGVAAGTVLRVLMLARFFDYDTGFYTDGGMTAGLALFLPLALAVGAALCFWRCKNGFINEAPLSEEAGLSDETAGHEVKAPGKEQVFSKWSGAMAGISGGVLLAAGWDMLRDYQLYGNSGLSMYPSARQEKLHLAFLGLCLLFGLVRFLTALRFFGGWNAYRKLPLLDIAAVAWGMAYLIVVYVFFAKSSSQMENMLTVGGGAAQLLGLYYLCRLLSGVDRGQAAYRMFILGGFACVLVIPYHLSNILLALSGWMFMDEMPVYFTLCGLTVGLSLLSVILDYFRRNVDPEKDVPQKARHMGEEHEA